MIRRPFALLALLLAPATWVGTCQADLDTDDTDTTTETP
jgi:hypothetical protein